MSNTVIKVENLSKQYRLGEVGTGTLSHDLKRWWHKVQGKEDPFLKIGEANDRTAKGDSDYVWALKDINFEVKQGEVLGIIGRNGAGKSTLLKILSKTTLPTTGSIKVKGRIASLLEVGTGFHPEMTGRENIFLNGSILGMTKREIKKKFDEIVDFAGVERYIDTPVKRYSSGMYVRLAFAVAAYLESEILIVDEVLAVGDAEFQKKCLGKMGEVSKGEGRTVLFVSHNMGSVRELCNTGILLYNGEINYTGNIEETIKTYSNSNINKSSLTNIPRKGNGNFRLQQVVLFNQKKSITGSLELGETFSINFKIQNLKGLTKVKILVGVYNPFKEGVLRFESSYLHINSNSETFSVNCEFTDPLSLKPDEYSINVAVFSEEGIEDYIQDTFQFEIESVNYNYYGINPNELNLTKILLKNNWKIQ